MSRLTITINQETQINRTRQTDLEIGLVLESPKGPVLTPTQISSESELSLIFGESSARYPVLSLARSYLKQYTNIRITRIKYKEASPSVATINDSESEGLIKVIGTSYSDYENGHTLVIANDDENEGRLKVTITGTDKVVRTNIIDLPKTPRDFISEFNTKSVNYKMEPIGEHYDSKEIKLEELTFSGGVQGSTFDAQDVKDAIQTFASINIPKLNVILAPGLNTEASIVELGVEVAKNRGETMYLADFKEGIDYDGMLSVAATYPRSDFLAIYYPSVVMILPVGANSTSRLTVPASAAALFPWAKSTETNEWSCPAGYNEDYRLPNTVGTAYDLSSDQAGEMYEATQERPAVNPIIFDNTIGYLVDGERTTDTNTSLSYPINVSRVIKYVYNMAREESKPYGYKPNTEFTWSAWKLAISNKLNGVKNSQGIQSYEVKMGLGETMTQEEVNQGIMRGIIRIQPIFMSEYINISIGVTTETLSNTGGDSFGF